MRRILPSCEKGFWKPNKERFSCVLRRLTEPTDCISAEILDYEMSYGEQIAVIPRNYPFNFRVFGSDCRHYAMIGTAHAADGYPLFYDAANEKGLCMAGLNFVNGASYAEGSGSASAPYEFIPLVLAKCSSVAEARELLDKIVLGNIPFSEQLPCGKAALDNSG